MTLTRTQQMALTGIGVGIVIGLVVGGVGGVLRLPDSVRGGLIGAFVVIALGWLSRRSRGDVD